MNLQAVQQKSMFKAKLRHLYLKALVRLDQTSLCASMWLWKKLKALPLPNGDLIHNIRHNQNTPRLLHDTKLSGKICLGKKKRPNTVKKCHPFDAKPNLNPLEIRWNVSREPAQSLPKSASSLPWSAWRTSPPTTVLFWKPWEFQEFHGQP